MTPRDPSPASSSPRSSDSDIVEGITRELTVERELERDKGIEVTLEKLGFGPYQWRLFALCGCGWMSDNSALACIAVILPRVQVHFGLGSEVAGMLSASTMAGVSHPKRQWRSSSRISAALAVRKVPLLTNR